VLHSHRECAYQSGDQTTSVSSHVAASLRQRMTFDRVLMIHTVTEGLSISNRVVAEAELYTADAAAVAAWVDGRGS